MTHLDPGRSLAEVEREHILDTLSHCGGNRTITAKLLKISVRSLRMKLHDYSAIGLDVPPPEKEKVERLAK